MNNPTSGPQVLTIREKSILKTAIVDDAADLGELYSKALGTLGYSSARLFSSANSIVDSILRDNVTFDIILMDFHMPGMNGIEASKIILRHNAHTKIILITANDSIQEEALSLGLYFLQKPFSLTALEKVLERLELALKSFKELERESTSSPNS